MHKCGLQQMINMKYYPQPEEYSEDEEGQMVIDEGPLTPENLVLNLKRSPSLSPKDRASPAHININNNELKINSFGQGFANAINIWWVETFKC